MILFANRSIITDNNMLVATDVLTGARQKTKRVQPLAVVVLVVFVIGQN